MKEFSICSTQYTNDNHFHYHSQEIVVENALVEELGGRFDKFHIAHSGTIRVE
jgi:hypothetical protein